MLRSPLVLIGTFLIGGFALFVIGAFATEYLAIHTIHWQVPTGIVVIAILIGLRLTEKWREDYWDVWSSEHNFEVVSKKRVSWNPKHHKFIWLGRRIWEVELRTEQEIRQAWVVTDRAGYPSVLSWK